MDVAKKIVLVVLDGGADRPTVGGKTPLMAASRPFLDHLATEGILGIMDVIAPGTPPGSDTAHLSLLGYAPEEVYTGRGPFEAAGVGINVRPGDIAFRGNFATVKDDIVVDRRAGRISDTHQLAEAIRTHVHLDCEFIFKESVGHRAALVLRGERLSHMIRPTDPLHVGELITRSTPLKDDDSSTRTASIVNEFTRQVHSILKDLPINRERERHGQLPANTVLLRGAGAVPHLMPFEQRTGLKAAVIAATALVIGIGKLTGMQYIPTQGATGHVNSNIEGKVDNVNKALKDHDFILLNIKGADEAGHDGNFDVKSRFLSHVDRVLSKLDIDDSVITVITADHSTPVSLKEHSGDPVPFLIRGKGVRTDQANEYNEFYAAQGGMHRIRGLDMMPVLLDLLGLRKKFGA
ncbi:MAG: 2,3-bisphosphoglycerate-independent phosphoglycerate mutase [Euryarchaeota archaeon]|nr:2,3-bisphosphoglycerate-independent phosphoglycerate mutase [Euryarchaeota archaeon]